MTNDAASTTTVISERDQRRIRAAMSAMPYAATERVPKPWVAMGDAVDTDAVVAFLHGLAEVLGEVAAESDKHRRRLFSLEAEVEAFRRLIGTAPAEVTRERAHRVAGRSGDQRPGVHPGRGLSGCR